ncbi:MAG: hypothetical protein U0104_05700 [Gemmatimonadales bacterium]
MDVTPPEVFARHIDGAYSAMAAALKAAQHVRSLREQGADPFEVERAEDEGFATLERTRAIFDRITHLLRLKPEVPADGPGLARN